MLCKVLHYIIFFNLLYALAFEEFFFAKGENTHEVIEQGRSQYQLLRERGNLPKYGTCWKSAVEHIDEGCRELSEEVQSDISLHLTNCFLEMSGHETYKCELDKKPNLRGICINSMSDRAFNVYTEFYTHTLNMCSFLQGQIWHETISENTRKVGKQLENTAINQEKLLDSQKESIEVQEKILKRHKILELVMEGHQETLTVLIQSVSSLQSWIVGEISWIDTLIYYVTFVIVAILFTSTPRTIISRLPILFLLFINAILERFICYLILKYNNFDEEVHFVYINIQTYIWVCRYFFIMLCICILLHRAYFYEDVSTQTRNSLSMIYKQNEMIIDLLQKLNHKSSNDSLNLVCETRIRNSKSNSFCVEQFEDENVDSNGSISNNNIHGVKASILPQNFVKTDLLSERYNLRSRQATPDSLKL